MHRIGVEVATELCEALIARSVPGLHFYTMNQSRATIEVRTDLGIVNAFERST
ncbi:MAG: methylenetetrahydrofolate reductase [Acidimicrobiales bacterium]